MRVVISEKYRELHKKLNEYLLTVESASRLNDEMDHLNSWELMMLVQYIIDGRVDKDFETPEVKLVLLRRRNLLTFIADLNYSFEFNKEKFKLIEDTDYGKYINFIFENIGTYTQYCSWKLDKKDADSISEDFIYNMQQCVYTAIFNTNAETGLDGREREYLDIMVEHLDLPNYTKWKRDLVINDIV